MLNGNKIKKRKAESSCVLTRTPHKIMLEEKELERAKKYNKSNKLVRRKLTTADDRKAHEGEGTVKRTKRVKKQECRKPEKQQSRQGKDMKAKRKNSDKTVVDDKQTSCLYCGEMWFESKGTWIKCQGQCEKWAHTACAGVGAKDEHYVCELCQ